MQIEEYQIQKENDQEKLNNKEAPEEIIMEGYVECNEVPILEEKIILRKDENNNGENLCHECQNENIENNNAINTEENNQNICNECKQEINIENTEQQNNIENVNNEEVNEEENNIKENEEGEEMNEMEQEQVEETDQMKQEVQQDGEIDEVEQQEQEGEEMNNIEQGQNMNEIGEEENLCDDCMIQQQNEEGNDEQKVTQTVQVLVPENQNEN